MDSMYYEQVLEPERKKVGVAERVVAEVTNMVRDELWGVLGVSVEHQVKSGGSQCGAAKQHAVGGGSETTTQKKMKKTEKDGGEDGKTLGTKKERSFHSLRVVQKRLNMAPAQDERVKEKP